MIKYVTSYKYITGMIDHYLTIDGKAATYRLMKNCAVLYIDVRPGNIWKHSYKLNFPLEFNISNPKKTIDRFMNLLLIS